MLWFSTLLLAALPQAAELPFSMDLPADYLAFSVPQGQQSVWVSSRADGKARFELRHYQVAVAGASSEGIANDFRQRQWLPYLQQMKQEEGLAAWQGEWSGETSAGSIIHMMSEGRQSTILQRVLSKGDRLTLAIWEGPAVDESEAATALDSFQAPLD